MATAFDIICTYFTIISPLLEIGASVANTYMGCLYDSVRAFFIFSTSRCALPILERFIVHLGRILGN